MVEVGSTVVKHEEMDSPSLKYNAEGVVIAGTWSPRYCVGFTCLDSTSGNQTVTCAGAWLDVG